ncbi:MAG: N-acetylmuramoyl-L-alanine amidase [Thermoanaerobaculaceae bacterium]
MQRLPVLLLLALSFSEPLQAAVVTGPTGSKSEVFSRGDLVDVLALLQIAGAKVGFSAASGSYVASAGGHEVHFTPGGSLAVVDGELTSLPGPVRTLENHVVATIPTCAAVLKPLGFQVVGTAHSLSIVAVATTTLLGATLEVSGDEAVLTFSGLPDAPTVLLEENGFRLLFSQPVQLLAAPSGKEVVSGFQVQERELRVILSRPWRLVQQDFSQAAGRLTLKMERQAQAVRQAEPRNAPVVVLDPGHGGEDQGAKGPNGLLEKDLTLAIAKAVASRLQEAGVTVRLTREGEETVALSDRVAFANRLQADCFVSIHANAAPARGARGAETYFMSLDASDPEAAQAAARENASAGQVQLILWELAHVAKQEASSRLALELQTRLNQLSGIRDRGVKQAPFAVLTGATMPAVLVEVGFLTNPEEELRLASSTEQARIASALTEGILAFLNTRVAAVPAP